MIFRIILSKQSKRFLDNLSDNQIFVFKNKLSLLSKNPFSRDNNLDIKPLKGKNKNCYRLRIGNYRILYEVIKSDIVIFIFKIDKRKDIY